MTQDRSRSAFDVRQPKHWSSLQAQQGRLLSDDDWNEADAIDKEDLRRTRADVIGPSGSPDDGFKVSNPSTTANGIDFVLAPGTMYVGGLRATLEQPPETFSLQKDWLQQTATDRPDLANAERIDFVYLEVWQQPVTAVEDDELREVALGGPDTSVRVRTMRRVRILGNVGTEHCGTAWAALAKRLGGLSSENELLNDATLTVGYVPNNGPAPNLCSPSSQAGYLGAENQAIRVEIGSGGNTLLWGYDNASPLYRVQVTNDAKGDQVIHFLTTPKDEMHWPLAQQIVELLPWSAVLPNGQKVAETSGGFLTRVSASYDPGTQNIKVTSTVPATFGSTWRGRTDQGSLSALGEGYYYLRVWNRGADVASPSEIQFNVGAPVELAGTGITVTLGGTTFRQGDFWIIAARPESPAKVVPWKLESGRLAEGFRRFYAPLGIIHWRPGNGNHTFFDCRATFVPLTACLWGAGCAITVAPRPGWEGVFARFQPGQDVSVCFQTGEYRVDHTLVLDKLRSIKMTGAGSGTRIIAPGLETAFLFRGCGSVIVRELHVETDTVRVGREAVEEHLNGALTFLDCPDVRVSDCDLVCPDSTGRRQCALTVRSRPTEVRDRVRIERNRLAVGAWQTGILLVDVDRANVSGNHLWMPKVAGYHGGRVIPSFFVSDLERTVLEAVRPTSSAETKEVPLGSSGVRLHVVDRAVAAPLVRDFARVPPRKMGGTPEEIATALKRFARRVALGRTSALSSAGRAALAKIGEAFRAGGQGIVIAGMRVGTVQVLENIVEDMVQGIHVGVSNPTVAGPESADEILLARNVIHAMVPSSFNRDRHGIFVGNARSIHIVDTVASLRRTGLTEGPRTPVEGIRVHGVLGPFLTIRQSSLNGFTVGVRVVPLEPIPAPKLWFVAETIAMGATDALDAPASVERERNVR